MNRSIPARLKLTDFGLAKRLDAEESSSALSSGDDHGNAILHGAPSWRRPGRAHRPGRGYIRAGSDPLRALDRPAALPRRVAHGNSVPGRGPAAQFPITDSIARSLQTLESICLKCLEKKPSARLRDGAGARE